MPDASHSHTAYEDLIALPPHLVGEILNGVLQTQPRPLPRHGIAANLVSFALTGPFQKGIGGPGGWVFVPEAELHLGSDILVPDLAGWRRDRLPRIPASSGIDIAPDWVCEVLSPSTARRDRTVKRDIYHNSGVKNLWYIDPEAKTLEVFEHVSRGWTLLQTCTGKDVVSAAPFEATSFSVADLWPFDETSEAAAHEPKSSDDAAG